MSPQRSPPEMIRPAGSPPGEGASGRLRPWVPIRSLTPRHRARMAAHLLALDRNDRYLRFGYPASDEQVRRYVDGLDFLRDEVFGIFDRRLRLIAMAHLAYPRPDATDSNAAEFGGSVVTRARGQGLGARLFDHAILRTRNRGLDTLFIHALSENTAMLRIARQAGGIVHRSGSESDAYVQLPPETLASRMEQWVGEQAAAIDYRWKKQARILDGLARAFQEVRSRFGPGRLPPE